MHREKNGEEKTMNYPALDEKIRLHFFSSLKKWKLK